jgi:hypothetical protein
MLDFFFSAQIRIIIKGFFDLDQNLSAFKEHLRDFLVQIKVFFVVTLRRFCFLCFFLLFFMF